MKKILLALIIVLLFRCSLSFASPYYILKDMQVLNRTFSGGEAIYPNEIKCILKKANGIKPAVITIATQGYIPLNGASTAGTYTLNDVLTFDFYETNPGGITPSVSFNFLVGFAQDESQGSVSIDCNPTTVSSETH